MRRSRADWSAVALKSAQSSSTDCSLSVPVWLITLSGERCDKHSTSRSVDTWV